VAHCLTNTVQHESSASTSDTVLALSLTRGHPVLRRTKFEDDHEPNAKGDFRSVHHRVRNDAELPFAVTATPHTALRLDTRSRRSAHAIGRLNEVHVGARTVCARRAIGSTELFKVEVGVSPRGNLKAQFCNGCAVAHGYIFAEGVTVAPWSEWV
jgi:hypothetical protein